MSAPKPSRAALELADEIGMLVLEEPHTVHYGGGESETNRTGETDRAVAALIDAKVEALLFSFQDLLYPVTMVVGDEDTEYFGKVAQMRREEEAARRRKAEEALAPWRRPGGE